MVSVFDTYLRKLRETPIDEQTEHTGRAALEALLNDFAAEVIRPLELEAGNLSALILPEMPPLRELPALVAPTGQLNERERRLILLVEQDNFGIREVRPTALTEQTSSIEVFSVVPDEKL